MFETTELPPNDNIRMAMSLSSIVSDKYVRDAHSSEAFRKTFRFSFTQNHFLTTKLKAVEVEKE
jgi:hypothetical protein